MVNINIEIPDELHRALKLSSVLQACTLKELVTKVLDEETKAALSNAALGQHGLMGGGDGQY